jgi:integrase
MSITKRGPRSFLVRIRRTGYPEQSRTFDTAKQAEVWERSIESAIDSGTFKDISSLKVISLQSLLQRYLDEITPTKRSASRESLRIQKLMRHPIAQRSLISLKSVDFSQFRIERLKEVSNRTCQMDLTQLSHAYTIAIKDWSMPLENPLTSIRKPPVTRARDRRLVEDEEARLLAASMDSRSRAPSLSFCIQLAIETGMRAGEIVNLSWDEIKLSKSVIKLDITKNGEARTVPLSAQAEALIRALPRPAEGGRLTSFFDSNGLSAAFRRSCIRAGIVNLHFHDLRHEAASRLAPGIESITTLCKVMGWKTIQMALRYYHPTDDELVLVTRKARAAFSKPILK